MPFDDPDLSALIRAHASRHACPEDLRAAIRTHVALADAGRAGAPRPTRGPAWVWRGLRSGFSWRSAGAGFVIGLACAAALLPLLQREASEGWPLGGALDARPDTRQSAELDTELVADHVRALHLGSLFEVRSSDRHTVKPWFQGRLDYAPTVLDFAAAGFPLGGGRVEHVRGVSVAVLTYLHDRHVIDVFVWPASAPLAPSTRVIRGFNVLRWADTSMDYRAVSDLEPAELAQFARLWQDRGAGH